jgi:hypothetical protein
LARALAERDALENQILVQTRNLEQARAGIQGYPQPSELQALQEQQQFRTIYQTRIDQGLRSLGQLIRTGQWDLSLVMIEDLRFFITSFINQPSGNFLLNQGNLDLQGIQTLELALLAIQENWNPLMETEQDFLEQSEDSSQLLFRLQQQANQINRLEELLSGQRGTSQSVNQQIIELTTDLENLREIKQDFERSVKRNFNFF